MKVNKYLYGWKLYVNYGQGWEYETFSLTRKEMLEEKKAYAENCSYPFKISRGREINDKFWTKQEAEQC